MGREVKVGLSIIAALLAVFLYVLFNRLAGRASGGAAMPLAGESATERPHDEAAATTGAVAAKTEPTADETAGQPSSPKIATVLETQSTSPRGYAPQVEQAVPAVWEAAETGPAAESPLQGNAGRARPAPAASTSIEADNSDATLATSDAANADGATGRRYHDDVQTRASFVGQGPPSYGLDEANAAGDAASPRSTDHVGSHLPNHRTRAPADAAPLGSAPGASAPMEQGTAHGAISAENPFRQVETARDDASDTYHDAFARRGYDGQHPQDAALSSPPRVLTPSAEGQAAAATTEQGMPDPGRRYSPTDVPTPDTPLETLPSDNAPGLAEPYVPSYRDATSSNPSGEYRPGPMRHSESGHARSDLVPLDQHEQPNASRSSYRDRPAEPGASRYGRTVSSGFATRAPLNYEAASLRGARAGAMGHTSDTPRPDDDPASRIDTSELRSARPATDHFARPATRYTVQTGDSFWTIAQRVYGDGAYFRALQEHNRDEHPHPDRLRAGDVIETPPAEVLARTYPRLSPKPEVSGVRPAAGRVVARGAPRARTLSASGHIYIVEEGDTLFDIARYELGNAGRWTEIYELNRDVIGKQADRLRPGTRLVLPLRRDRAESVTELPPTSTENRY